MSLPKALQGDKWMRKTARTILPILVECAKNEKPITYSELDEIIVSRKLGHHVMHVAYGSPAGAVGDALHETDPNIPPLNALIVNKTGVPGKGCDPSLKRFLNT